MANNFTDDIKDFLYVRKEQFTEKYAELDGRYHTMKSALNLFLQRGGKTIVETGCQREENDWGGGMSTTIFGDFIAKFGGSLYTVDNNEEHLNRAKKFTQHLVTNSVEDAHGKKFDNITYILDDSVAYLKIFDRPIDLLYLDSFDFPVDDLPGGWDCTLPDQEIIEKHFDAIRPCQEHCLKELNAALLNLHKKSIILIDDNNLWGGGKPRLAREWLLDNGWELLIDYQQTLWIRSK